MKLKTERKKMLIDYFWLDDEIEPLFVVAAAKFVHLANYVPAHDETFDLVKNIADLTCQLHGYISECRSSEQAGNAIKELLTWLVSEAFITAPEDFA